MSEPGGVEREHLTSSLTTQRYPQRYNFTAIHDHGFLIVQSYKFLQVPQYGRNVLDLIAYQIDQ